MSGFDFSAAFNAFQRLSASAGQMSFEEILDAYDGIYGNVGKSNF